MNKALRFVWLSLLTLICGVASAGTVVFDPTQDATNAESVTKDGITFKRMGGERTTLDAYDKDGTTCWWFNGRYGIESTEKRIRSITFECLSGSFCDYVTSYGIYFTKDGASSTETKVVYTANDETGYDPTNGVLRFGGAGKNAFITKVTVQYVGGDDPDPDPGIGSLAIVFDPIRDATSAESVTKDGITFKRMGGDRTTLDAYDKDGTTCWWFNGRYGIESTEKRIRSITFECLSGSFCDYVTSYGSYFTKDVASSTETKVVYTANDATGYDPAKGVLRFGASGKNAFITKVTVVYVGGEDPGPDPGTGPGTGGEAGQATTIAQLAQGGVNVASATIQFTNAQVVYADGNNYIVRENNQALDILNTNLNLKQGQYLTGTVVLNVNYNSGILTTSDVTGLTDDTKLTFSGDELNEPLPILCATIAEMTNHPGDLVMIENRTCYKSYLGFYIYEYQPKYKAFYFSNEAGLVKNKNYHITAWYNSVLQSYNYPQGKVIKAEPAITTLAPPTISGEAAFTSSTTVTIKSSESVALIYYTLDGTEPTTESILYKDPFVLDKTTTVKAIAVYKTVTSPVASMDFKLIDLSAPQTIRDLAVMEKNLESVTVRFDNAQVVYGEGKNYILRENFEGKNYALDVLDTQLPLQVGATVSGTVKLQVNFKPNPAENNGVLSTADIAETLNHNLTITSGASVMPIPLRVSTKEVRNHPGDLLVVTDGWWYSYYGTVYIYGNENPTYPFGATYYVYVSNHSDYTFANYDMPDVMLWYNDVYTDAYDQSPLAKIIGEKETAEYNVTAAGWATFIVPFDYDKPDGLTIYECTSVNEDGKLVVEERDYLKANTPYLLKGGEANQILEGYAAKHAGTYTNGVMTGVYSDQEAPANSYILLNHPDEAGLAFYFVPDGITAYVDANRCYVNPRAGGLKSILFPDDETNGVTNANALDSTLVDVYTTAGVKVKHQVEMGKALNDLPAGLYIINNKKIVKK